MKKPRKSTVKTKDCVMFRNVPEAIYIHWKSICVRKKKKLKDEFVRLIKEEIRKDWASKSTLRELREQLEIEERERNLQEQLGTTEEGNFLTEDEETEMMEQSDSNFNEMEDNDVMNDMSEREEST